MPDATLTETRLIETTVTTLEMLVQPLSYPPMPYGMPLALLRCRDIPLHFYRYIYDRVGREWMWNSSLELSDENLQNRLWSDHTEIRVLYHDGAPCGFFELIDLEDGTCRILLFGLMRHVMGKRIARWFLGCAIDAAWARNPRSVVVETCTLDHPAALTLYQKMGFEPVSRDVVRVSPLSPEARAAVLLR